jgi:hypothetical protein
MKGWAGIASPDIILGSSVLVKVMDKFKAVSGTTKARKFMKEVEGMNRRWIQTNFFSFVF